MRKHSKTMKSTVLVCALWMGCSVGLFAQEFKTKLANSKDRKISIEMDASTLKIEGYDGDELIIKGNGFQDPPEQAKGLRSLYNSAVDNTGIGLAVTTQGNGLKIEKASVTLEIILTQVVGPTGFLQLGTQGMFQIMMNIKLLLDQL